MSNIINDFNILLTMSLVKKAWSNVHTDVIVNGFKEVGFTPDVVIKSMNHDIYEKRKFFE